MAEKSGFFNAREAENGTYDREYDAEQFAEYFANFISNGVYANPANQLKVVFDDSPSKPFVVIVRKGKAYIDGYWYELTEDMEITIPANTKAYIVKDVIRCTLDKAERKVSIVLEEDVTSDHPTNNNNRHDLILSTIIVQPNASKLNAEDITDKRPDKTYCGFVTGVIDQIDTTELFRQYDDAFQNWFNEMKDQLSTDVAVNLQIQIGNLQKQTGLLSNLKTTVKDSIVNAINSLYDSIIGKTLKTLEEVSSNTEQGHYVDALAVAELNRKTSEVNSYIPDREIEIGTFYDGKPLYQQTKMFNNIAFTNGVDFVHKISDVDSIFIYQAFLYDTDGNYGRSIPITESKGNVAGFRASRTVLRCIGNGSWDASATRTWVFVLRYTKL